MKNVLESSQRMWAVLVKAAWLAWFVRVPLAGVLVSMVLLAMPDTLLSIQARELLVWAAESPERAWPQFLALVLGSVWLHLVIRLSALRSLVAYFVHRSAEVSVTNRIVFWLSTAQAAFVALASALASLAPVMTNSTRALLLSQAVVLFGAPVICAMWLERRARTGDVERQDRFALGATAICGVAISLAAGTNAVQFAHVVGGVATLLVAIACWTATATLVLEWSLAMRVPVGLLALAAALVFSGSDINDNHIVRTTRPETPTDLPSDYIYGAGAEELDSLRAWLRSRTDIHAYRGSSYPVIVVLALTLFRNPPNRSARILPVTK